MSKNQSKPPKKNEKPLSDDAVIAFLRSNPEFFIKNPEILSEMKLPEKNLGDNIEDFQSFAINKLQKDIKETKQDYETLVGFARDNNSTQNQVHRAILSMIRARTLEELLEFITIDLTQLFNVDVVRLAMESELSGEYDNYYPEQHYSGIVFVESGLTDVLMGEKGVVLLCEDTTEIEIYGTDQIFSDCEWLVRSCCILRLNLSETPGTVMLAFGVREAGRFHAGQGIELLLFLAQILQERLDECLKSTGIENI